MSRFFRQEKIWPELWRELQKKRVCSPYFFQEPLTSGGIVPLTWSGFGKTPKTPYGFTRYEFIEILPALLTEDNITDVFDEHLLEAAQRDPQLRSVAESSGVRLADAVNLAWGSWDYVREGRPIVRVFDEDGDGITTVIFLDYHIGREMGRIMEPEKIENLQALVKNSLGVQRAAIQDALQFRPVGPS